MIQKFTWKDKERRTSETLKRNQKNRKFRPQRSGLTRNFSLLKLWYCHRNGHVDQGNRKKSREPEV